MGSGLHSLVGILVPSLGLFDLNILKSRTLDYENILDIWLHTICVVKGLWKIKLHPYAYVHAND